MSSNKLSLLFRLRPANNKFCLRPCSFQHSRTIITPSVYPALIAQQTKLVPQQNLITKRFKKTVKRSSSVDDNKEEEEDDDDDELAGENPLLVDDLLGPSSDGSKRLVIDVTTLRLDGFAKTAFGATRGKIEEAFYKGELFLNGEKPSKKSADLQKGDEIDLIRFVDQEDRSLTHIKRVQIIELPDKASDHGRMKITIDRWEDLTVKDYGQRR